MVPCVAHTLTTLLDVEAWGNKGKKKKNSHEDWLMRATLNLYRCAQTRATYANKGCCYNSWRGVIGLFVNFQMLIPASLFLKDNGSRVTKRRNDCGRDFLSWPFVFILVVGFVIASKVEIQSFVWFFISSYFSPSLSSDIWQQSLACHVACPVLGWPTYPLFDFFFLGPRTHVDALGRNWTKEKKLPSWWTAKDQPRLLYKPAKLPS